MTRGIPPPMRLTLSLLLSTAFSVRSASALTAYPSPTSSTGAATLFPNSTNAAFSTGSVTRSAFSTGVQNATITAAPTYATTTPPGYAIVNNVTFPTSCPYSDLGCFQTCISLAEQCETSWSYWAFDLNQKCTNSILTTYATYTYTWTSSVFVGDEVVIPWTNTYTETPGLVGYTLYSAVAGCTNPGEKVPATTVTSPYTVVFSTPVCSSNTIIVSTMPPPTVERYAQTGTYALGTEISYSVVTVHTTTETAVSSICSYSVPPPACPFNGGPALGGCTRGPNCNDCTITGGTVRLLYFPDSTALQGKTIAEKRDATSTVEAPATAVFEGHTLTSPSAYISFNTVYAENECSSTVGQAHTGSIIGIDPTDLSVALGNWHARITDISEMYQGRTQVSMYAQQLTLAELNWPYAPWVWDEQQRCNSFIIDDLCPLIISGQYNPILAVPSQIRTLDPEWATCALDLQGLYDPPIALTPGTVIASVTLPGHHPLTSDPASPSLTAGSPTASATALPSGITLPIKGTSSGFGSSLAGPVAQSEILDRSSIATQDPTTIGGWPAQVSQSGQASESRGGAGAPPDVTVWGQASNVVIAQGTSTATLARGAQTTVNGHTIVAPSAGRAVILDGSTLPLASSAPTQFQVPNNGPPGQSISIHEQGSFVVVADGTSIISLSPGSTTNFDGRQFGAPNAGGAVAIDGVTIALSHGSSSLAQTIVVPPPSSSNAALQAPTVGTQSTISTVVSGGRLSTTPSVSTPAQSTASTAVQGSMGTKTHDGFMVAFSGMVLSTICLALALLL